jgi:hypothetical protein
LERMTGIEPAFSAWESARIEEIGGLTCCLAMRVVAGVDR